MNRRGILFTMGMHDQEYIQWFHIAVIQDPILNFVNKLVLQSRILSVYHNAVESWIQYGNYYFSGLQSMKQL